MKAWKHQAGCDALVHGDATTETTSYSWASIIRTSVWLKYLDTLNEAQPINNSSIITASACKISNSACPDRALVLNIMHQWQNKVTSYLCMSKHLLWTWLNLCSGKSRIWIIVYYNKIITHNILHAGNAKSEKRSTHDGCQKLKSIIINGCWSHDLKQLVQRCSSFITLPLPKASILVQS